MQSFFTKSGKQINEDYPMKLKYQYCKVKLGDVSIDPCP